MRHQIKDDVDAEGISNLFGEPIEIEIALTLAFPAIAYVAIVNDKNHHPPGIVKKAANRHFFPTFATENAMRLRLRIARIKFFIPELHGRNTQSVQRAAKLEH